VFEDNMVRPRPRPRPEVFEVEAKAGSYWIKAT